MHYLHRCYSPSHGRWISRDPITERGGYNLYGFLRNRVFNTFDYLGLAPCGVFTVSETEVESGDGQTGGLGFKISYNDSTGKCCPCGDIKYIQAIKVHGVVNGQDWAVDTSYKKTPMSPYYDTHGVHGDGWIADIPGANSLGSITFSIDTCAICINKKSPTSRKLLGCVKFQWISADQITIPNTVGHLVPAAGVTNQAAAEPTDDWKNSAKKWGTNNPTDRIDLLF